jgi:hypothetical protein
MQGREVGEFSTLFWWIRARHFTPCLRARQEQLAADVGSTWSRQKLPHEIHGGDTEKLAPVVLFKSRRMNDGDKDGQTQR